MENEYDYLADVVTDAIEKLFHRLRNREKDANYGGPEYLTEARNDLKDALLDMVKNIHS